ncbi:helix-turn-helix transcriptional regulator [Luteimonas sp. gir]|uniref:helix-turn-helix domain-containing protein n=1 Tax=Luteimonas sp. gir TaxID=3127960 RepID=UPI003075CA76
MQRRRPDSQTVRVLRDALAVDIAYGRVDLAQAVKRMRKISGLTQVQFAKHRGMSLLTLKRIESGKGNPTVETLESIGNLFGLRVAFVHADPNTTAHWLEHGDPRDNDH